jgi:hypothetical protein
VVEIGEVVRSQVVEDTTKKKKKKAQDTYGVKPEIWAPVGD